MPYWLHLVKFANLPHNFKTIKIMKTIKQIGLTVAMVLTLVLSSCSKDDNGGGGGATGVATFRAKVGGANFTSIPQGAFAILASNGAFQNLALSGSDASGKSIQLSILAENIGVGTYQITDQGESFISGSYNEVNLSNPAASQVWGAPYDGGGNSGSIIITAKTATNVQGTFSFTGRLLTGTTTKVITEGFFNLNITTGN